MYYDLLSKRGENINLTAISGAKNVTELHFLDSIAPLYFAPFLNKKVIDIGSGAGFPGVPLKLAEPTIDLTLLDATKKRVNFLSELCCVLSINAICIHARAEDAAHNPQIREQYDICVSRAVAKLNILCELCLPFVAVGGLFIAMKSTGSDEELEASQNAITTLGAITQQQDNYTIADTDITHRIIVIQKTSPTPDKYPRRFSRIQNSPL